MAKYIIDVPSDLYTVDGTLRVPVKVGNGDLSWYNTYIKAEPYTEPGREAIEDEVWDLAQKLGDMNQDQWISCFGVNSSLKSPSDYNYQDAKAAYEAWKNRKDEIRVGDEVIYHGNKYVVGYVEADEVYHIVDRYWIRVVVQGDYQIFKTGRHFPEVAELLKKMRDAE